MINPFDQTFFKFLTGFICIIIVSLTIVTLIDNYHSKYKAPSPAQVNR